MNKPAWIAWDELTCKGECIRCGTALFADVDERADDALARHVGAHGECTEDEADRRREIRDRNDIRSRLERLRLVDSSDGLALRSPIDASTMAALVTDGRLAQSSDQQTRAALGRVLVAISDLYAAARRSGWTKPAGFSRTHTRSDGATIMAPKYVPRQTGDYPEIVRSSWQSAMGFIQIRLPEKIGSASIVNMAVHDDICSLTIHKDPSFSSPTVDVPTIDDARAVHSQGTDGYIGGYLGGFNDAYAGAPVASSVDEYIRLHEFLQQRDERRLELAKEQLKIDVAVKRAQFAIDHAKTPRRVVLAQGNCLMRAHATNPARTSMCPRDIHGGKFRITDIAIVGVTESTHIEFSIQDHIVYNGSYGTLRKQCASIAADCITALHNGIVFSFTICGGSIETVEVVCEEVAAEDQRWLQQTAWGIDTGAAGNNENAGK